MANFRRGEQGLFDDDLRVVVLPQFVTATSLVAILSSGSKTSFGCGATGLAHRHATLAFLGLIVVAHIEGTIAADRLCCDPVLPGEHVADPSWTSSILPSKATQRHTTQSVDKYALLTMRPKCRTRGSRRQCRCSTSTASLSIILKAGNVGL